MRTARLDFADPGFPVSLVEVDDPALPGEAWARIAVLRGGICGSDLHAIHPDGTGSPIVLPLVGAPMEMGHEVGGVVVEAGSSCPVAVGARVAVNPIFSCHAQGLSPCRGCRDAGGAGCRQLNAGEQLGMGHGFSAGLGGGWADQLVAHASQLHEAPANIDDASLALAEPLAIALHGVLRRLPREGEPAVVIGAGAVGLAALAALRWAAPSSSVTVAARHPHQAEAAVALGAADVVPGDDDALAVMAERTGARVTGRGRASTCWGGFGYVVDAVGSTTSLDLALRAVDANGTVLVIGAIGNTTVDLAPVWLKNVHVVGTFGYGVQEHDGAPRHDFDRALELLGAGGYRSDVVVTRTLPLDALREAVGLAGDRRVALKVHLEPTAQSFD